MKTSTLRTALAALVIAAVAFSSSARPAQANTTSTIVITAAAVAAIATGFNVAEKNAKANTVVGYLRNGSTVFADGHVVAPNGQSWYPGNYGQSIACNGPYCAIVNDTYNSYGGNGYPAYATTYDTFVPAYTGFAAVYIPYRANGYYGGSRNYYNNSRTVNTYTSTTSVIHREPSTPPRVAPPPHHDPVPVRSSPKPWPPRHPDDSPPR
jgi:hypothetical protein